MEHITQWMTDTWLVNVHIVADIAAICTPFLISTS